MSKLSISLALSVCLAAMITFAPSTTADSASHPHRTTVNTDTYGANDGGFSTNWYRLNHATTVTVTYSSVTNSHAIKKQLRLPKGTVLGAQRYHHGAAAQKLAYTNGYMTPNISYHLKSKLVNDHVYGFGAVSFKLSPKSVTQIVRPAYGLPYGSGTLYAGGLNSIKTLNRNVNAIKLTSDGYVETYRNQPEDYPSFWGTLESHYDSKPNNAQKINLSVKNGNTVELYYQHHLKGVHDTQVRKTGNTQYRLTIKNQHTPYQYTDSAYAGNKAVASIYAVGGVNYFTVIGSGWK
ncbi:hypothetical protein [Secundilactobacillus odoratitofui]|nr:hypothetical protein [Secundilactobacillus odoratitofui]